MPELGRNETDSGGTSHHNQPIANIIGLVPAFIIWLQMAYASIGLDRNRPHAGYIGLLLGQSFVTHLGLISVQFLDFTGITLIPHPCEHKELNKIPVIFYGDIPNEHSLDLIGNIFF